MTGARSIYMPEHYSRDTSAVLAYCSVCNRRTLRRVDDRRIGSCTEHEASKMTKAQEKRREKTEQEKEQPELF
jgi:hypothetical protein